MQFVFKFTKSLFSGYLLTFVAMLFIAMGAYIGLFLTKFIHVNYKISDDYRFAVAGALSLVGAVLFGFIFFKLIRKSFKGKMKRD